MPEAANHNLAVVGFGERKLLKQYKVGFSIAGYNVRNLQHLYLEDAVLLYTVYTDYPATHTRNLVSFYPLA